MRFYLSMCCLLISQSGLANNLQSLHHNFSQLSATLSHHHQAYQDQQSKLLDEINYHYIKDVGGIFLISYSTPLTQWFATQESSPDIAEQNKQHQKQAQHEFTNLRVQAKHLSHQIYSLERKLKSLKNTLDTSNDRVAHEKMISDSQAQLNRFIEEKQRLKPIYHHVQQKMNALTSANGNEVPLYLQQFEQQLFSRVCQNNQLLNTVTEHKDESLSFVLKHAGAHSDLGYQDINYSLSAKLLAACANNAITEDDFRSQLRLNEF